MFYPKFGKTVVRKSAFALAPLVLLSVLPTLPQAQLLEYAAKFVCGVPGVETEREAVKPGNHATGVKASLALNAESGSDGLDLVANWNDHTHQYSDVWAEGNFAYLGHYLAQAGVDIIDISDPSKPTLAAVFLGSADNEIRDVHVENGIGFFSSDSGGGVYVVDVSNPYAPIQLYRITAADGGYNSVHTLSVEGDYLYEADNRTPVIKVFDISDSRSPRFVRDITSPSGGAVHEVTAKNGRLYTAVISGAGHVDIFDISNVADEAPLLGTFVSGSATHTSWPTDDGEYVAVARETLGGDVSIWDIRNLPDVKLVATIIVPTVEAYSAHQIMVTGNILWVSWYQAGVRVYDITEPSTPFLTAHYDTFPGPVIRYDGCWGVYPFLGPDRILASDIDTGLYVLSMPMASISGQKFNDLNGDGKKDKEEPGLVGWTIFLDANDNGKLDDRETSITTDADGNYSFTNLGPDIYRVREVLQPGWKQTTTKPKPIRGAVGVYAYDVTGLDFGSIQLKNGLP